MGVGAECIVYEGISNQDESRHVAIKQSTFSSKSELIGWFAKYLKIKECGFYQEYEAFLGPEHGDKYQVILVQELLDKNITEILIENEENKMSEKEVQRMIFQIVQQLNILTTNHNLLHLDIKPTNIMRRRLSKNSNSEYSEYTLIDFGFSMENDVIYNGYIGTKEWSPPEMKPSETAKNAIYESSDMWSIGLIVIYCLFNGHHPFCYKSNQKTKSFKSTLKNIQKWYQKKIVNKQCSIESWLGKQLLLNTISYDLFDFLFKCLRFDPYKRLTPNQALRHKWLQSIN